MDRHPGGGVALAAPAEQDAPRGAPGARRFTGPEALALAELREAIEIVACGLARRDRALRDDLRQTGCLALLAAAGTHTQSWYRALLNCRMLDAYRHERRALNHASWDLRGRLLEPRKAGAREPREL